MFLWIPLFLLMLHSVTPHHHASLSESLAFAQEHDCPSNFLSDIFEFDLGDNHLEEFEISKTQPYVSFDLKLVRFIEFTFPVFENQKEKPRFQEISFPVNHQYLDGSYTLRAPPSFIV